MSGTYAFTSARPRRRAPTLNITGLTVQNTDANGMRINVDTDAITTFTRFDNLVFLAGTTTYLNIYATSLYLTSSGCPFGIPRRRQRRHAADEQRDADRQRHGRRRDADRVRDGDLRPAKTTAGYCQDCWTIDDDPEQRRRRRHARDERRGRAVRSRRRHRYGGDIEGFPTAAFDWNTFAYYSTYVAFHDVSGTVDRVYVRDQAGRGEVLVGHAVRASTIVGTPRWNTGGTTHYLYVATASGKIYRLIDNGTSLVQDGSGNWAGAATRSTAPARS